jgi:hypothetical protein
MVVRQWAAQAKRAAHKARTIPIFAAGAMLARAGLYDLDRFTSTLSFVMCGFEHFGSLHRAALDAFADPGARSRFASMLDWRFPECGPLPGVWASSSFWAGGSRRRATPFFRP